MDAPEATTYAVWRTPSNGSYTTRALSLGPLDAGDEQLATFDAPDWETAKRMALDIQVAHWVKRPEFMADDESSADTADRPRDKD
jgi:hypothetical protein